MKHENQPLERTIYQLKLPAKQIFTAKRTPDESGSAT